MKLILGHGPKPTALVLLGEAPGANETLYGRPFVGEAGDELTRMLTDANIDRKSAYVTNVFKIQPPGNDVNFFFTTRSDPEACTDLPSRSGKYLRDEFRQQYLDLLRELVDVGPTLVLALGATALWALLGQSKISSFVGTLHQPTIDRPYHILPTYHPAAVLRQWSYRSTVVANFQKAKAFLDTQTQTPRLDRNALSKFRLEINPTMAKVRQWTKRLVVAPEIAVDIETAQGQIRTIAFCCEPDRAYCIPFWEPPAQRYWPDTRSEIEAWNLVREILQSPGRKILHNGAFDLQYLWRGMGIPTRGDIEDTMLLHHALEPELPKGLGQLAATYLNIPEWKTRSSNGDKDED